MRILLVINGLDFGGTESAVQQLALRLAARGHDARVLAVKRPGRVGDWLRERGIDVATLGMRDAASATSMMVAAWKMRRVLRRYDVDVVQSFLPRANIVSRVANRLAGRRALHVSSERSTDFRRKRAVRLLNLYTARWSDSILAVSPMVRDVLVARDRLRPEKIAVLENGIDLGAVDAVRASDLRHEIPALLPGRLIFCSVGRFVPEKGFQYLVRAFGRMRHREDAQLLVVGEGPEESAVRAEVRELGLERQVHFGGFRQDVLGILKGSDAYVLSSVEEGSPMAVLEAMACSLPIIATDVSGVRGLVGPSGPGCAAIVVPPAADWSAGVTTGRRVADGSGSRGDAVGTMAEAMDRVVCDATLREDLRRAGRRRVEDNFTLDRIVERLETHYIKLNQVASRRSNARRALPLDARASR
jgi:glycosyltransferase involved in cell wall biosynthesis